MKYLFPNKSKSDLHKILSKCVECATFDDDFQFIIISNICFNKLSEALQNGLEKPEQIYEMHDWENISQISGSMVSKEVYEYFLNILPPIEMREDYLQVSEAVDCVNGKPTFHTFIKTKYPDVWKYVGACWRNAKDDDMEMRRKEQRDATSLSEKTLINKLKTIIDIPCEIVIRGITNEDKPDIKITVIIKSKLEQIFRNRINSNRNFIYDGPFANDDETDDQFYYLIFRTSL